MQTFLVANDGAIPRVCSLRSGSRVISGYYRYHAIPGKLPSMNTFRTEITRCWFKTLRRRGQKHRINWERFGPIVKLWIPVPTVLHPYPNERFYAKHPR
jgi:RNA-directed DNA polymerase